MTSSYPRSAIERGTTRWLAALRRSWSVAARIQVEYSCKYSLEEFAALAAKAGLAVERVWLDAQQMFSVQYLVRAGTVAP